jgi:hypothetical protein
MVDRVLKDIRVVAKRIFGVYEGEGFNISVPSSLIILRFEFPTFASDSPIGNYVVSMLCDALESAV